MADIKYDYNKDGVVNAADLNMASENQSSFNFWDSIGVGAAAGAGTGAIIGGVAGAVTTAGLAAAPAAGIGGAIGGVVGGIGGAIGASNTNNDNRNNLTNMLKEQYGFSQEEVDNYFKSIDVLKSIDEKTNGQVSKINNIAKQITDNASLLQLIKNGSFSIEDIKNQQLAAAAGSPGAATGSMATSLGIPAVNKVQNAKSNEEMIKILTDDMNANASQAGINLSNIKNDEKIIENVTATLDSYKTDLGIYAFPNLKVDATNASAEDKNILSNSYNLYVNKIATKDKGLAPIVSGTASPTLASQTPVSTGETGTTTVDNGDGTTSTITKNADGTGTMVTKDTQTGKETSSSTLSETQLSKYDTAFAPKTGTSTHLPTDYIGLTDSKTYRTDPTTGQRVETDAIYKYADVDSFFNGLTETDIKAAKRSLYASGYYGSSDIVSALSGNITAADKTAIQKAMGDANLNGLSVNDYLKPKYETFLLTGRPAGEAPVDLNGDGKADADTVSALRGFFDNNGLNVTDDYINSYKDAIIKGETTIDDVMKQVREKMISSAYPSWKDEINSGKNVKDIASPYVQAMATTLGIPADQIELSDPNIQNAISTVGADGKPTYKSLFDFKKDLRKDARWQNTDEAQKEYSDTALSVLKTFGIIG